MSFGSLFTRGVLLLGTIGLLTGAARSQGADDRDEMVDMKVTQAMVNSTIAAWKSEPQKTARTILAKYGLPGEVSANRLIWHNNGPWKITVLVNEEIPHDFPMPHKDMLYQAINYRIDPKNADELLEYDGSVVLERTKGEIAARCHKEEANFLAINLANDVATGRRTVGEARRFYSESIMAMMKGQPNEYLKGFQFDVARDNRGDRDKPHGTVGTSGR